MNQTVLRKRENGQVVVVGIGQGHEGFACPNATCQHYEDGDASIHAFRVSQTKRNPATEMPELQDSIHESDQYTVVLSQNGHKSNRVCIVVSGRRRGRVSFGSLHGTL
jgi:hypothetical protein